MPASPITFPTVLPQAKPRLSYIPPDNIRGLQGSRGTPESDCWGKSWCRLCPYFFQQLLKMVLFKQEEGIANDERVVIQPVYHSRSLGWVRWAAAQGAALCCWSPGGARLSKHHGSMLLSDQQTNSAFNFFLQGNQGCRWAAKLALLEGHQMYSLARVLHILGWPSLAVWYISEIKDLSGT